MIDLLLLIGACLACMLLGAYVGWQEARERYARTLRLMAAHRMSEHGPMDPRGAAIWDCASFITEHHPWKQARAARSSE